MPELPFHASVTECSLGLELELQIINSRNGNLVGRAKDLIRDLRSNIYSHLIKPELTQSMIEINSTVHLNANSLLAELKEIKHFLNNKSHEWGVYFSGGGTHPFQLWQQTKIFPTLKFKNFSKKYGYLAKRFTVFGQHVHIGCTTPDDAIYLSHILQRYIPHFIALSAASPFYNGIDTCFDSSRVNVVSAFPTSGHMPLLTNWQEFSAYIEKYTALKIIKGVDELCWDIRPKPEFGTVEIRVFDAPLTLETSVMLAAYAQTLARYILHNRPLRFINYDELLYKSNYYQASRHGLKGNMLDPYTQELMPIKADILATLEQLKPHAEYLNTQAYIEQTRQRVTAQHNDAQLIRQAYAELGCQKKLALYQSQLWMQES